MPLLKGGSAETTGADETPIKDWRRWCRLCAKDDSALADESNMDVFNTLEQGQMDSTLATAIGKYFWVNIRMEDTIPKVICAQCHTLVTQLTAFTERVNKVQALFCMLQNSKTADAEHAQELRAQYGLLTEEWVHIIAAKKTEEVDEVKIDTEVELEVARIEEAVKEDEEEEVNELEEENAVTAIRKLCQKKYKNLFEAGSTDECYEIIETEENLEEVEEDDVEAEEEMIENEDEEEDVTETTLEEYVFADEDDVQLTKIKRKPKLKENEQESNHVESDEDFVADIKQNEEHEAFEEDTTNSDEVDDSDILKELKYKTHADAEAGGECDKEQPSASPEPVFSGKRGRPRKQAGEPATKYAAKRKRHDGDGGGEDARKYVCSVCNKPYKNATSYRKHMSEAHEMTSDLPDFACSDCGRLFATERMRNVHERTHLPFEAKCDIPCPFCEKKFSKISVMRQHVSGIHDQLKPFICDECGRALKTLAALNEHKLVHTDDCPYECEVCHARFKNKPRLKIHMDTHSENPYVCSECGKKLNTRRTLKMHMLVHTEEKTLKCDFCSASFKRAKALKNHLILHTGLRPYKCNFCDKTFSNGSNCRSHKKKLHPQELEEEEAQGIKNEPIITPKLDELRASTVVVETPRQVKRSSGGLPLAMRALLLAAEERAKNNAATSVINAAADEIEFTMAGEEDDDDEEEDEVVYEIIDEI